MSVVAAESGVKPGLQIGQFRRVAERGFGDGNNSYAHCMAWFNGHLFVGTSRMMFQHLYTRREEIKDWDPFPVIAPTGYPYACAEGAGEVWRYHPPTDTWAEVLVSEMMPRNEKGELLPFFCGTRNMIVLKRAGESAPALYVMTNSPKGGPGPLLYRTFDGSSFEQFGFPGINSKQFTSFRPLVEFKGWLFSAATGKAGNGTSAGAAAVFATRDPVTGPWQQVNPDNFGDPYNETVFEMEVFNGYIYAGTLHRMGCQLWKTDAEGEPPFRWTRVLTSGGYRGPFNEAVGSLCVFKGALYAGVSIIDGGYDERYSLGPAAAEVLRVYPDDSFDIVCGDARLTPDGWKYPLSGMGPGFDKSVNTYFWRMCVHEGWLYVTTMSAAGMLPYLDRTKWPPHLSKVMDDQRTRQTVERVGGFDLWRSRNGRVWQPVTRNGFGNPYNYGGRTLASTPCGLFVGTANPYGPEVATKRANGWVYEPNPRGGCEIWLGSYENTDAAECPAEPDRSVDIEATPAITAVETDGENDEAVDALLNEWYEGSGFRTFGWWHDRIRSVRDAARNLVDELLDQLPGRNGGALLDLGGAGGSTAEQILRSAKPSSITVACFDRPALDDLRKRLSKCEVVDASKPRLHHADGSFACALDAQELSRRADAIEWLREVSRVLKPGGVLSGFAVLSDNEATPWDSGSFWKRKPATTAKEFESLLRDAGFEEVETLDVSRTTWEAFAYNLDMFAWGKNMAGELDQDLFDDMKARIYGILQPVLSCLLYRAKKAGGEVSKKSPDESKTTVKTE